MSFFVKIEKQRYFDDTFDIHFIHQVLQKHPKVEEMTNATIWQMKPTRVSKFSRFSASKFNETVCDIQFENHNHNFPNLARLSISCADSWNLIITTFLYSGAGDEHFFRFEEDGNSKTCRHENNLHKKLLNSHAYSGTVTFKPWNSIPVV